MSPEVRTVVLLLHLVAMLFMAAPLYMLIVVNERARFAVPPNYNTDRYMENIIKRQPMRCYAYLAVILVTGLLLTIFRPPWSPEPIWTDWALIAKLVAFALLAGLLSYVHFNIQPRVERILAGCNPGEEVAVEERPTLLLWRTRRKRLAATCLFLVLTAVVMGLKVASTWAPWLVAVFLIVAALFVWRVYRNPVRFGWF